jgi:hypothetical protein
MWCQGAIAEDVMRVDRFLLVFAGLLTPVSICAQGISNVQGVASRATVIFSDGIYKSCGLRFVGLDFDPARPTFPTLGFDFNLTVMNFEGRVPVAVLKTEVTRSMNLEQLRTASGKLERLTDTWVQAEGAPPLTPSKVGIAGENGLSSMTTYHQPQQVPQVLGHLMDVATGSRTTLLLGAKLASERGNRVYRFTPEVKTEDGEAFVACAKAMVNQMTSDTKR